LHSLVAVGRDAELDEVERFLTAARPARALVLSGDAGIGKTTIWEAGLQRSRANGVTVLCARASEAETKLSFAALADLLEAVDAAVIARLPAPQRRALEIACGRADPIGSGSEPLAVSTGVLGVLRVLSDTGPLLIAIDDVAWIDPASLAALVFAARRLADRDVRFVLTRRAGRAGELERALEPGVHRVVVGALSFGAISALLSDRLGRTLPRRVLRLVFDTSHGNPLFALELGRAVVEHGVPELGAELPMPQALDELFAARLADQSADARRGLLAVALSGGLTFGELARVVDPLALQDAQASAVLVVDGMRVRAAHPLLASAALRRSSARERRELHLALARSVTDTLLRARHLALATSLPDAGLADELSVAAELATERAAVHDAVALAEHALRLTPAGDPAHDERLLTLARCLWRAGEPVRVTELLTPRIDSLAADPLKAAAHLLLGSAAPSIAADEEHVAHAIALSAGHPALHAQALGRRSFLLVAARAARIGEAERLAREALAVSADPDATRRALVALAWARIMRGCDIADLIQEAAASSIVTSLVDRSIERVAGVRLAFRGELERARRELQRVLARADEVGEAGASIQVQLCEVELRTGDTAAAARLLADLEQWMAWGPELRAKQRRLRTQLAALRGQPESVAEMARSVVASSGADCDRLELMRAAGLAAVYERDLSRAIANLEPVWRHTIDEGVDDPGAFPVAGDLVEALAEQDALDVAGEVIARLERLSREQRHPWGLATVKRSSAVVELAHGYDESAATEMTIAASDYRALGLRFDSARTLMLLGRVQRRFKQRAAARRSLSEAVDGFARLGCVGWAESARGELARVSGRRPGQAGSLTTGELGVAELAARGLSNKEIAAQLFISVYTVQTHLRRVYEKLGIRSRTQLGAALPKDH
jgi:DNA-binding CsgD family transcriptional regulator